MIQRGQRLGFALEAGDTLRVAGMRFRQDLDGDLPIQAGIDRAIHLPHAAFAQQADDLVVSEPRTGGQSHARNLCGLRQLVNEHPSTSLRRRDQNVAMAFTGNPVPPMTGTGATVSRNSHRF